MTRSGSTPRLRRAALLLGALLHLLGAVAGPALHGGFRADPHAPGWSAQRDEAPAPAHDEQACVVCQASHTLALPAPGAPPIPLADAAPRAEAPSPSLHPSPARIRLQARAPPAFV